jgi:hypothetical protein
VTAGSRRLGWAGNTSRFQIVVVPFALSLAIASLARAFAPKLDGSRKKIVLYLCSLVDAVLAWIELMHETHLNTTKSTTQSVDSKHLMAMAPTF